MSSQLLHLFYQNMISRWKSPALTRNITYSMCASFPDYSVTGGALRIAAQGALSRVCEDNKEMEKVPNDAAAAKSSYDPWAPIFDDLSTDAPPVHSPRPKLPPRFFTTSRPTPKPYFSSNISRSGSGSGRREYGTQASQRGSKQYVSL